MNVFARVTIQSLKKNKTRTLVTIIGVILSAAMICAVTTFVSSMQNYIVEYTKYTSGDWHGAVFDCDGDKADSISRDERVSDAALAQVLGYSSIDSSNSSKPYLYVLGGNASFYEMLPIHLVSGRMPENSSEIIIPSHLLPQGGISYQSGDVITLPLSIRIMDGMELGQFNAATHFDSAANKNVPNDETLVIRETRSYTVVGVYLWPYALEELSAPGFTALTVADTSPSDDVRFDVYFKLHKASQVYDFIDELGLGGKYNTDLLLYSGISRHSTFSRMLLSLAAIVIALIMLGSISLIYNAFSISVSERTKQFGLLSSVGATKRQLGKMVIFESLLISAVGIPLGIASGIGGIAVTLLFIGGRFSSMIGSDFAVPMHVCVSWQSVAAAAVIALLTVLISAYIPSRRATRISAIEAIRQNADISSGPKTTRSSKLGIKLFGLPGLLASRHYKRNRRKYRTTVLSLFMSIVLFISSYAFSDELMRAVEDGLSADCYVCGWMWRMRICPARTMMSCSVFCAVMKM